MKKIFLAAIIASTCSLPSCKTTEADCIDQSRINPDTMCITLYDPVCGCDGKTYGNSCEADRAGVTAYTKGECNSSNN